MIRDEELTPLVVDEDDRDGADGLCERVVRCVAAASNTAPTDLPPLQYAIETESLEALYERSETSGLSVSFEYDTFRITIDPAGTVAVFETQARGVESPTD